MGINHAPLAKRVIFYRVPHVRSLGVARATNFREVTSLRQGKVFRSIMPRPYRAAGLQSANFFLYR